MPKTNRFANWIAGVIALCLLIAVSVPFLQSSHLRIVEAWIVLWLVLFMVGFALIALEGAMFMEKPAIHKASQVLMGVLATGIISLLIAAIAAADQSGPTL